MNPLLTATRRYTQLVAIEGINSWKELLLYMANIPYGRTSNREDLSLVISENKGTCSSKHALLKHIAKENNISEVRLILGMYKMNPINTPGIGSVLHEHDLEFIPEAHCYLMVGHERIDITRADSGFHHIKKDLLQEVEIQPEQVGAFKVNFHKDFLQNWLEKSNLDLSLDELWDIREQCITSLSQDTPHPKP